MKQTALFSALLGLLLTAACKKDSCIEGTVTDVKTGKPIAGVSLSLSYRYYAKQGSILSDSEIVRTDSDGNFDFTACDQDLESGISVSSVTSYRYSRSFGERRSSNGDNCSHVDIQMIPLDGYLNLMIRNETGAHDTIIVWVNNQCEYLFDKNGLSYTTVPRPLVLQKGEVHAQTFGSCVGDTSSIRWRFTKSGPWFRTDSVFIKTADTTFFKIVY